MGLSLVPETGPPGSAKQRDIPSTNLLYTLQHFLEHYIPLGVEHRIPENVSKNGRELSFKLGFKGEEAELEHTVTAFVYIDTPTVCLDSFYVTVTVPFGLTDVEIQSSIILELLQRYSGSFFTNLTKELSKTAEVSQLEGLVCAYEYHISEAQLANNTTYRIAA